MNGETIEQAVTVRAPREKVFAALTRAGELVRWFPTRATSDPRQGGAFHYEWTFAEQPERDHEQKGEYAAFDPPSRLSYPWRVGPARTQVDFELSDSDGACQVALRHSGWEPSMGEAREQHSSGWAFFLENLRSVLEEGVDRRSTAVGMKTQD